MTPNILPKLGAWAKMAIVIFETCPRVQLQHLKGSQSSLAETEEPVQTLAISSSLHRSSLCGTVARRKLVGGQNISKL